jgi:anti-anti-sigma regulatory factor
MLRLEDQADIRVADELLAQCRDALASTGDVTVDASAVQRIDTAVLQCLLSLSRTLRADGRQLVISEPSPRFEQVAAALGLEELVR